MSYTKPTLEQKSVLALLQKQFAKDIVQLEAISIGHMSQTYSFMSGKQAYIIRFNATSEAFEKDTYAFNHFSTPNIPIPRIVTIGQIETLFYAISEKIPSTMLNFMDDADYRQVIPSVIEVLDHIHHVDVRKQHNFSYLDTKGVGVGASWRQHLASISKEKPYDEFGLWHTLFHDSFLEKDVFNSIYQRMLSLLNYCPEERYLLHGDYGFDNVLAHEGKVSAVLDWALSQYGDFLYDVAYLHYFSDHYDFQDYFRQFYENKHVTVPFYSERMLCYTCYIGLSAMKFFASRQQEKQYHWARERVLSLIRDSINI